MSSIDFKRRDVMALANRRGFSLQTHHRQSQGHQKSFIDGGAEVRRRAGLGVGRAARPKNACGSGTGSPHSHALAPSRHRYGGIYQPKEAAEAVDPKIEIDKKCGVGCTGVWEIYEKCAVRIEEKV